MNYIVIVAAFALIIAWETLMLWIDWTRQASSFAGQRYARAESPKAFWVLFALHLSLCVLCVIVLTDVLLGWFE